MKPNGLQPIYASRGNFATAYLEPVQPDAETVHLRWRALCELLGESGADQETIAAMAEKVESQAAGRVAARGLIVVGRAGEVVLVDTLGTTDGGDRAGWAPLPDLGRYVRAKATARRQVLAVVDGEGANLLVRDVAYNRFRHLEGRTHPLHNVHEDGWAHKRLQSQVEELAERNAAMVAEEITRVTAQAKPAAIVLAGEVEARSRVLQHIPRQLRELVTVTDRMPEPGSTEDLGAVMADVAADAEEHEREELRNRLEEGLRADRAVEGTSHVLAAFRHGAVDTLLYLTNDYDLGRFTEELEIETAIGPEPLQLAATAEELRELCGADIEVQYDKLDSAVIRAAILSGTDVEVVDVEKGRAAVAALLRFPAPVTVPGPRPE